MWLVDLWRKQTSSDKWITPGTRHDGTGGSQYGHAEESGQIEKAIGPFPAEASRCAGQDLHPAHPVHEQ